MVAILGFLCRVGMPEEEPSGYPSSVEASMQDTTKQILLRQPAYTLELLKSFDDGGAPRHAFVLHPAVNGRHCAESEGINLLMGEGHEVSRRDMHYALYLFQRFHLNQGAAAAAHG